MFGFGPDSQSNSIATGHRQNRQSARFYSSCVVACCSQSSSGVESAGTLQDCDVAVRSRSAPPNRTSCGFVWLIWFLRSIWFNQINKTSQTNQLTETNQTHRTDQTNETGWRRFSASLRGLSARPGGRPSGPRLGGSPLFGKVSDGR